MLRSRLPLLVLAIGAAIAAPALLPGPAWADADSDLDKAIAANDKDGTKRALAAATSAGDAKAAATILRVAAKLRTLDVHKEILDAIKGVKDEAGLNKLVDAAKSNGTADIRYILVEGLAMQGSPTAAKAVLAALEDKDDTVLVVAIRSTRLVASGEAVEKLVARLEKGEKNPKEAALCRELNASLAAMTGENLSFALEWKGWWMSHKDSWRPKGSEPADDPKGGSGGETVMRRIAKDRPSEARTLERMSDDDVIVIKGSSDQVESVLKAVGVKHTVITKDELEKRKLDPKSILILNCDGKKRPLGEDMIAKVRDFVDKGGYIFSSDWVLEETIEKAFPQSIQKGGFSSKSAKDEYKVDIKPVDGKNPLLRDVFPLTTWDASALSWQMDGSSHLIKILSPDVVTLIESVELKKRFPEFPAVAVTFFWKGGRVVKPKTATGGDAKPTANGGCVLHVLSHFKHQKDKDSGDKFALQQLLMNFFLEKQAANKAAKQ